MKCPECKKEITMLSFEKSRIKRLELILSQIVEGMYIVDLYRGLRSSSLNKYPFKKKQFHKDLKLLEDKEKIFLQFDLKNNYKLKIFKREPRIGKSKFALNFFENENENEIYKYKKSSSGDKVNK